MMTHDYKFRTHASYPMGNVHKSKQCQFQISPCSGISVNLEAGGVVVSLCLYVITY